MNFFLNLLIVIIAFFVVAITIIFIVKIRLKRAIGKDNFNNLVDAIKKTKDLEIEEYSRPKNVSGVTKLLEPSIIRDFPEFNKELLYRKTEKILNKVFDCYHSKNLSIINNDEECSLIIDQVNNYVDDLKERHIDVSYSSILFHEHAIKDYEKKDGVATITTSSTLEYYYTNSNKKSNFDSIKKQTRYTCKFVYVFDESKLKNNTFAVTIRCPNCGAPLAGLGDINCTYCGSNITPINLKAWKMAKFKEDYAYGDEAI